MTGGKADDPDVKPKTKVVKKERKLKIFEGTEGIPEFKAWKENALAAIDSLGYTGEDAGKHLYDYLGTECKREIRLAQAEDVKTSATKLLEALSSIYGDNRTLAQRRTAFYNRKQSDNETILEFSHSLLEEMDAIRELDGSVSGTVRLAMLKDQFAENVRDKHLRWELKKRKDDCASFKDLRQVALEWAKDVANLPTVHSVDSSTKTSSRSTARTEAQVDVSSSGSMSAEVEARFQKLEKRFDDQSSTITTMLARQGEILNEIRDMRIANSQQKQSNNSGGDDDSFPFTCFFCKKVGHKKSECDAYKRWKSKKSGSGN